MKNNMSVDRKKSMVVIICIVIAIILLIFLAIISQKIIVENNYREAFKNGMNLGVGINIFDMKNEIGLVSSEDYEKFSKAYDTFYFDATEDNFKKLVNIISLYVPIEEIKYGKSEEGLMDGLFIGDTSASIETLHRNGVVSDEMYEEFYEKLEGTIHEPNHEKTNEFVEYMKDLYQQVVAILKK